MYLIFKANIVFLSNTAHVRRHTGERYKCDICGDGFIQGYHLTQHKRNKHGIDTKSQISRLKKFIPTIDGKPVPLSALSKTSDEIRSVKLKSFKLQLPEQLSSQQSQQISEIIQIDDSSHASASLSGSGQQISSPFQVSEHNIKLEPTINIIENEAQSTVSRSVYQFNFHEIFSIADFSTTM